MLGQQMVGAWSKDNDNNVLAMTTYRCAQSRSLFKKSSII